MTTPPQLWAELQSTFQKDLPATTELLSLLEQERSALETRDYDVFQQLLDNKKRLLAQLRNNSNTRTHALQAAGFNVNDEASALAIASKEAPATAKAWNNLSDQWKDCQHLNAVNERVMQRTKLVVSQTLSLLRGVTDQDKLYDPKGMASNSSTGRTITSA
jgi:flagella synthesis protein FlgN